MIIHLEFEPSELAAVAMQLRGMLSKYIPADSNDAPRDFVLYLTGVSNALATVQLIREVTDIGLQDAKMMVDRVREGVQKIEVLRSKDYWHVSKIADRFRELGATVTQQEE